MDITATFQFTAREFRSALRNVPATRRARALFVFLLLLGLIQLLRGQGEGIYIAAGALFFTLFFEFSFFSSAKRSANLIGGPWTMRLTDRAYHLRTPVGQAESDWSGYAEATGQAGFWYLSQHNRVVSILPHRAFDEVQRRQLAAFFAARLPPRKRPWYRFGL